MTQDKTNSEYSKSINTVNSESESAVQINNTINTEIDELIERIEDFNILPPSKQTIETMLAMQSCLADCKAKLQRDIGNVKLFDLMQFLRSSDSLNGEEIHNLILDLEVLGGQLQQLKDLAGTYQRMQERLEDSNTLEGMLPEFIFDNSGEVIEAIQQYIKGE